MTDNEGWASYRRTVMDSIDSLKGTLEGISVACQDHSTRLAEIETTLKIGGAIIGTLFAALCAAVAKMWFS